MSLLLPALGLPLPLPLPAHGLPLVPPPMLQPLALTLLYPPAVPPPPL
jgi:hypothetical protein